jgi:hypothetical protein
MSEEPGPSASGHGGGVAVPVIPPGAPRPAASAPIPPTMVLGYVDLAIRGVLEYERYAHVYLSPWWALDDLPDGTNAWKRAVLERVPLKGARHWGHLYLVVSDVPSERGGFRLFRSPPLGGPVEARPGEVHVPLREGVQRAELVLHPTYSAEAAALEAFGREVEVRFRRQMD